MNAKNIIKKYHLKKRTWTHKGFHGVLHFFFPLGRLPIQPMKEYFGDCYQLSLFFFHDDYGEWYWNNDDLIKFRRWIIETVNQDPSYLKKLLQDWHKRLKNLNELQKNIDETDLAILSKEELVTLYKKWRDIYLKEYALAVCLQDAFSMDPENYLHNYFKNLLREKGYKEKIEEYYLCLVNPIEESFITQEYRDLLLLHKEKKQGKNIHEGLQKHIQKWHWLQNNYALDLCLDETFFAKKLGEIKNLDPEKEIQRLDFELKEKKRKKEALIKKLNLSPEAKNLIRITEVFAYMQDERKKYVLLASHYQSQFIDEFGKRLKLNRKEMEYTYIEELPELLEQKKIDTAIFEERKRFTVVIHTLNGFEIFSGDLAEEVFKTLFEQKQTAFTKLQGIIASKGKASGPVKVVNKVQDLNKVHRGDILVATMTRPEMIIAMKKAAAIVTDEGGVTCHAAVVSRELRIPCIIGTKNATKVLKDGDLVEVDANNGIIKKRT